MKRLVFIICLLTCPASAEQPQQTPSQVARQMVNVINNWADAIDALQQQNAQLQQQLSTITKERDDLKMKAAQTDGK